MLHGAMTLERYLAESMRRGVTDHRLHASVRPDGLMGFYIHPAFALGPPVDFITFDAAVMPVQTPPEGSAALCAVQVQLVPLPALQAAA